MNSGNLVKRMNPRTLIVGGCSLVILMFAIALVFMATNREDVVVVNAMAVSTGGGGTVNVADDLYTQQAVMVEEVNTVDYSQAAKEPALLSNGVPNDAAYNPVAQTGTLDELWDQLTPEQQAIYETKAVFLDRIHAWVQITGGDAQAIGGDPAIGNDAGGSVPQWALDGLYVSDPTVDDPMIGGGAPVTQVDISTPNDVGGGTNGVYVPTSLVATCGGHGAPCESGSVTYNDTPPPPQLTYTVTNPETGETTTHDAAPNQGH